MRENGDGPDLSVAGDHRLAQGDTSQKPRSTWRRFRLLNALTCVGVENRTLKEDGGTTALHSWRSLEEMEELETWRKLISSDLYIDLVFEATARQTSFRSREG